MTWYETVCIARLEAVGEQAEEDTMADQPSVPGGDADRMSRQPPERWPPDGVDPPAAESNARTPRWVKVFGLVGVLLVLLIIVMLLSGHSPGRHMHGGLGGHVAPVVLN